MATKTISLELDAYEKLRRAKREGESFSEVVRRARFGPADASGSAILSALKEIPVRVADEVAVQYWASPAMRQRPASPPVWEGGEAS